MKKEPTTLVRIRKTTKDFLKKLAAEEGTSILELIEAAVNFEYSNRP